jgi:hypothetical protein
MRALLLVLLVGACAGPAVVSRPCPAVTEFPEALQQQARLELDRAPALARMMDAMAADREFNRAICPR